MASGLGAGNNITNNATDIKNFNNLVSEKLSDTQLTDTVKNIVSSTLSNVIASSSTKIEQMIKANNSINLVLGKDCPPISIDIEIRNVKQNIKVNSVSVSNVIKTIMSDISSTATSSVTSAIKKTTEDSSISSAEDKIGSTFQGVATEFMKPLTAMSKNAKKVLSNAGACLGFGNTCNANTTNIDNKTLQDDYQLDSNFNLGDTLNPKNMASSNITQDDINSILSEITGSNAIGAVDICPDGIEIVDVLQKLNVNSVKTLTSVTQIANRVASNYISTLSKTIDNMTSHKKINNSSNTTGDIPMLGAAMAGIIEAGGNAAEKVIDAAGTQAAGITEVGIKTVGDILGAGLGLGGSVLSGVFYTILGIVVVVIAFLIWFFLIRK